MRWLKLMGNLESICLLARQHFISIERNMESEKRLNISLM